MTWHARLALDYRFEAGRCVARFEHDGPLRILQALYPEGDGVCHNVLVHPPGGLVGGGTLEIAIRAAPGSHGLVTTPGATRFYPSQGEPAVQRTQITLDEGARLEWLPLEAICHSGCRAENHLVLALAPGAELIGWDVTALGLPESRLPFEQGSMLTASGVARIMAGAAPLAMMHPLYGPFACRPAMFFHAFPGRGTD